MITGRESIPSSLEKIGWDDKDKGKSAQKKLDVQSVRNENALKKCHEQLALEANRNNLNLMRERSTKIGQVKR